MRNWLLWLLVGGFLCGCGGAEDVRSGPPTSARRDIVEALRADGWYVRSDIVWVKGLSFHESYSGSVMPESFAHIRP